MFKSKKGVTLVEIMVSIIISGITIASCSAFFVRMYGVRYFNVANLYFLESAISTFEEQRCFGQGTPYWWSVGREHSISSQAQEEYMIWSMTYDMSNPVDNYNNFVFPAGNALNTFGRLQNGTAAGGAEISRPTLLCMNYIAAYPFTRNTLDTDNRISDILGFTALPERFSSYFTNGAAKSVRIADVIPAFSNTTRIILNAYILNDAFTTGTMS